MVNGPFAPFSLGNVLGQAEQIRGARTENVLRQQQIQAQNALVQRAAQFDPLAERFFAGETDVGAQLFALDPEKAAAAQEFAGVQSEEERAEEQREAGAILRGVQVLRNAASPSTSFRLLFPEQRDQLIEQGVTEDQLTDDAIRNQLLPGLIAEFFPKADPDEFKAEDFFDEPEGDFIQFQNPKTGETRDVRKDSDAADVLAADPNFQQVSRVQRIEQGGVGAFTSSQIGERELNFEKQTRSVAEVTSLIDRLIEQVTESGAPILGIVGAAQRFAGEAGATIDAAADVFGIDLSPEGFNFDDFDADAVKSAQTRSNIVKLSFLIAQTRNPSGRITEPDVQAAIREMGASADPAQFVGVLQEVRGGVISSFNILARQQRQSPDGFQEFVVPLLPPGAPIPVTPTPGIAVPTDNSEEALRRRLGLPARQ